MGDGKKEHKTRVDSLTVDWVMGIPPMKPARTLSWNSLGNVETQVHDLVEPGDDAVTQALNWSPLTLAVLRYGFVHQIDRFHGWDGAQLSKTLQSGVQHAARIYKRGVGYSDETTQGFSQVEARGSYKILKRPKGDQPKLENSFVVIDRNVYQLWSHEKNIPLLWDQASCEIFLFDSLESHKNIASVAKMVLKWQEAFARNTNMNSWCAVGGGLLGDLVGFCAGLLGLPVIFVPTTLLAMVDACVGGKTGINFDPYGKNQVGLFYFPKEVWIWLDWLTTLPERQWRSGALECIKHALLENQPGFLNETYLVLKEKNLQQLDQLIMRLIEVKAGIVARDAAETGERAVLNLGHTLGHALEARSQKVAADGQDHLMHGEAVGFGMMYGIYLSQKVCGFPEEQSYETLKIIKDLVGFSKSLSLKTLCGYLGVKELKDPTLWLDLSRLMGGDKKNKGALIQWVLLRSLGQPWRELSGAWTTPVDMALVEKTWYNLVQDLSCPPDGKGQASGRLG